MEGEPKDPNEEIDRKLGTPATGAPPLSEDEAWGTKQNPVRETPPAFTGLRDVGR